LNRLPATTTMLTAMHARPEPKPVPSSAAPELKDTGPYWAKFLRLQKLAQEPAWLAALRNSAMNRFVELGFPTLQDEDWRFTNIAPIVKLPFRPVLEPRAERWAADSLGRFPFTAQPARRLVFVDGHFAPELSAPGNLLPGLRLGSLAQALTTDDALLQAHLFHLAQPQDNAFAALNAAFFRDGALVVVPPGMALAEPVHLLFISTGPDPGTTAHVRNLIVAEAGSRLTVVESYVSLTEAAVLTNTATELTVGDQAVVEHIRFQDESLSAYHLGILGARLGLAGNVIYHCLNLGARLSRTNLRIHLAGEGLQCILNGLYLTRGDQLADHHMIVEHAQPNCASHEYFNGILADKSKGVFHGRILVRPGAHKTDAKQTNKNLLLSDDATVDTKPQLEIYADDVKCTHGATVGQLDPQAIFYLRSRGLGLETARRMLIHAFAGEIIERVRHTGLRDELDQLVWTRLEAHEKVAINLTGESERACLTT